ncbi:hypothetical protein [Marivivens donghaensis]|uniref:hypothetical protein n=1 Tax=Marivivens donghaensis TaxID=1699413 RepID=UPI00201F9A94|nr:hypothetical protein [Marivivens donghaensis]MCL7409996.1 hypothetical protein [Marivivens donghaensis]MDN3705403.1 hypothetical protein [Marivivens donghaensis]
MFSSKQVIAILGAAILNVMAGAAPADEVVLYCAEQHMAGMQNQDGNWSGFYGGEEFGRRYAIRFNDGMTEVSGVQGSDTVHRCERYFPNKAPDVVTCVNSQVATMHFSYSTESKRFVLAMLGPGGWLAEGTERGEQYDDYLPEQVIMGQCQSF